MPVIMGLNSLVTKPKTYVIKRGFMTVLWTMDSFIIQIPGH